MKIAVVLVAIFAASAYATPEADPLAEAFAAAVSRAIAEPGWNIIEKVKGIFEPIYNKACINEEGDDRCKSWLKDNFSWDAVKKWGAKFEKEVKEYCEQKKDKKHIQSACQAYDKYILGQK